MAQENAVTGFLDLVSYLIRFSVYPITRSMIACNLLSNNALSDWLQFD